MLRRAASASTPEINSVVVPGSGTGMKIFGLKSTAAVMSGPTTATSGGPLIGSTKSVWVPTVSIWKAATGVAVQNAGTAIAAAAG